MSALHAECEDKDTQKSGKTDEKEELFAKCQEILYQVRQSMIRFSESHNRVSIVITLESTDITQTAK